MKPCRISDLTMFSPFARPAYFDVPVENLQSCLHCRVLSPVVTNTVLFAEDSYVLALIRTPPTRRLITQSKMKRTHDSCLSGLASVGWTEKQWNNGTIF